MHCFKYGYRFEVQTTNFQTTRYFNLSADKSSISHNFFGLGDEEQQDNELKFKVGQVKLQSTQTLKSMALKLQLPVKSYQLLRFQMRS